MLHKPNLLKALFCFIAIVISVNTFAQTRKYPYTLLWEIKGNGLTKPSWLFGTMHVTNSRVFNFSDSVMVAIEKSKGFAMEVHPDTITKIMLQAMQQTDSTKNLRKLLGEKEYNELSKKFEKRNGYPLTEDMNPLVVESTLKNKQEHPGDKQTFVDGYLYGIARTMNKNIYGLEDATKQFNESIGSADEMRQRLLSLMENDGYDEQAPDELVRLYSEGNLDEILKFANENDIIDSNIIERNKVMASGIIRYMKDGPLFTAVGVAHLPGKYGVIELLRQAGYTVTNVPASFTGVAAKYKINYSKVKWVNHTDENDGYSMDFPNTPLTTTLAGLKTVVCSDLADETYYGIYSIKKGTDDDPAIRETVIGNILKSYTKNATNHILVNKQIVVNGLQGTYILLKKNENYERIELFFAYNTLYILYAGNNLNTVTNAASNKVFESFKCFRVAPLPQKNWITYTKDTAAFSIQLPCNPKVLEKDVPSHITKGEYFRMNIAIATDTNSLTNYIIRYNDYPTGTYLANTDALFSSLGKEFGSQGKLIGEPVPIKKDGYEGREMKFLVADRYYFLARLYVRGNRLYLLAQQNGHEGKPVIMNHQFFDSFTLLPYLNTGMSYYQPDSATYKIKLPEKPKIEKDTTINYRSYLNDLTTYFTKSPMSGSTYYFEHTRLSKYYKANNTDSLYKNLTSAIITYRDSLLKTDTIIIAGKPGREVIKLSKYNSLQSRVRVLFDGNNVFYLGSKVVKDELYNETSNTFFNSLVDTIQKPTINITASKAGLIMNDLLSTDTSTYKYALGAFSYYKFSIEELPVIYTALQRNYADDTSNTGARSKMLQVFKTTNDDKTAGQLLTLYNSLQGKDELKAGIISDMAKIDKQHGYDTYLKLLLNEKPLKIDNYYSLFMPLFDSLAFSATHFQQLVPLFDVKDYKDEMMRLCRKMIDYEKADYKNVIKANFNFITKDCFKDLDGYLANTDSTKSEWKAHIYDYLKLMDSIKNEPVTNSFTNYYIKKNPKGTYFSEAIITRINNGLPVSALITNRLMEKLDTRYDIMQSLYLNKQYAAIPGNYKTQSEFGRLCLYQYIASDDDDDIGAPENIVLLGNVEQKGMRYYAYQFKQPGRDEKALYIGIAGPYKPGATRLNFKLYNAYTAYDEKKLNWKSQATGLIKDLTDRYTEK